MERVYDFAGIGIGPFNLGLAALSTPIPHLNGLFFDKNPEFRWHPGLLFENSTLQVAFYADLVTMADPTSPFSFLAYLKAKGRLISFGILENIYITRKEYNDYCSWVAKQLPNLYFGHEVKAVYFDHDCHCYQLKVQQIGTGQVKTFYAKKLVIGVGSVPRLPACVNGIESDHLFHSSEYLFQKKNILGKKLVTIIGSGQSAAEIFEDLLAYKNYFEDGLHWFTRAGRFYPMDYSKLTLEMSTPDYIDHFYQLPERRKERLLHEQDMLYKGINYHLIERIYQQLYSMRLEEDDMPIGLVTNCELREIHQESSGEFRLTFYHREIGKCFIHHTGAVILATGYRYQIPKFILPLREHIDWDKQGRYLVNRNYSVDKNGKEIFVQNAELHTHGFNAADLSLGPYRNAVIINEMLGKEYYKIEKKNTFQHFGLPIKGKEVFTISS